MTAMLMLLVVFGSTTISYSQHYCQDELKEVVFFKEAEPCCGGETKTAKVPSGFNERDCCQIKNNSLKAVDSEQLSADLALSVKRWIPNTPLAKQHTLYRACFYTNIEKGIPPPPLIPLKSTNAHRLAWLQTYRI